MKNLNFKENLRLNEEVAPGKTKISIYDFDSTLVNTPTPEEGIPKYEEHGKPWKIENKETAIKHGFDPKFRRVGWYGRDETLRSPIFDPTPDKLNQEVFQALRQDRADPATHTVVMTGRHGKLEPRVREILQTYGIDADDYFFKNHLNIVRKPGYPKTNDTYDYKEFVIADHLMNNNIKLLEIWDDRAEHIEKFVQLGKNLKNKWPNLEKVIIHDVIQKQTHEI
jgi:hypothetical protein